MRLSLRQLAGMRANPYSGVLAATANALNLLSKLKYRKIVLYTRSRAVLTFKQPRQQSGQNHLCSAYKAIRTLLREGNTITIVWLPSSEENELLELAREKRPRWLLGKTPRHKHISSYAINYSEDRTGDTRRDEELSRRYWETLKRIDKALPGRHTRTLYDQLSSKEAGVLAQLRTGMARLNAYLHRIEAVPSDQCACGQARETVEHYPFPMQ